MSRKVTAEEARQLVCPVLRYDCITKNCMFFESIGMGTVEVPADFDGGTALEQREFFVCNLASSCC